MRIDIVTLFPELCDTFLHASILGRAADKGLFEAHCHQIRDYTLNKQKQTDDYPYGGGCGMVLYAQPIADCLREVTRQCEEQGRPKPHIVFMTAGGKPYNQQIAKRLASYEAVTLVCGHYEGIDERVIEAFADEEISIGDYVLTGGELASLVVADSVLRLQPGVLAEEQGYQEESHWDGLLEYPQYTRPEVSGGAAPCLRCCSPETMERSPPGGRSRPMPAGCRRPDLYKDWCLRHPLRPRAGSAASGQNWCVPMLRWMRRHRCMLLPGRRCARKSARRSMWHSTPRSICAQNCSPTRQKAGPSICTAHPVRRTPSSAFATRRGRSAVCMCIPGRRGRESAL